MIQLENAVARYRKLILDDLKEAKIKCWVAGGCLRDYFMGVPIKTDIDLFFPDEANYNLCAGWFKGKGAEVKWESDKGMKLELNGRTFDLIKMFFAGPQETIDDFDFTVCQFSCDGDKLYHGETSFIDLAKRQLMIHSLNFPPSTMKRAFRYYTKGFRMCIGEMAKLVKAIQDMPKPEETNQEVSEEPESNQSSADLMGTMFIGID